MTLQEILPQSCWQNKLFYINQWTLLSNFPAPANYTGKKKGWTCCPEQQENQRLQIDLILHHFSKRRYLKPCQHVQYSISKMKKTSNTQLNQFCSSMSVSQVYTTRDQSPRGITVLSFTQGEHIKCRQVMIQLLVPCTWMHTSQREVLEIFLHWAHLKWETKFCGLSPTCVIITAQYPLLKPHVLQNTGKTPPTLARNFIRIKLLVKHFFWSLLGAFVTKRHLRLPPETSNFEGQIRGLTSGTYPGPLHPSAGGDSAADITSPERGARHRRGAVRWVGPPAPRWPQQQPRGWG